MLSKLKKDLTELFADDRASKLAFALATSSVAYNLFTTFVQFYYTDFVKLSASLVGSGLLIFGIWNTLNDPLAGVFSDKAKQWFGSKIKFGRFLVPFIAVSFALVWVPRISPNDVVVFIYFLLVTAVFDFLHSLFDVNLNSLTPVLYKGTAERTSLTLKTNLFTIVQIIAAFALTPVIYARFGWWTVGVFFGGAMFIFIKYSLKRIHVPDYAGEKISGRALLKSLPRLVRRPYFLNILAIWFFSRLVLATATAILPFFLKYSVQISEDWGGLLIGSLLVGGAFSLLFWRRMIENFGSKKALALSLILTGLSGFLALLDLNIVTTGMALFVIGFSAAGSQIAPIVMSAEVADIDRLVTGKEREGVIYGGLGMAVRFPPAIAGLLLGYILAAAHYNANLEPFMQPDTVGQFIRYFLCASAVVSTLTTLIFASRYRTLHDYKQYLNDKE